MSVKPVAWMDEHGCTCNDAEKVVRGPGFDIPLYSAPAPELAEALQKLVDWNDSPGFLTPCSDDEIKEVNAMFSNAKQLLARITPK